MHGLQGLCSKPTFWCGIEGILAVTVSKVLDHDGKSAFILCGSGLSCDYRGIGGTCAPDAPGKVRTRASILTKEHHDSGCIHKLHTMAYDS
jgi:hypothetical protein